MQVLVIEDSEDDYAALHRIFGRADPPGYQLTHAVALQEAFVTLEARSFEVVLLDLHLPGSSGLETLEALLDNVGESAPPIVVLTGLDDEELAAQALKAGAQDYLVKGDFDTRVLTRTVRHAAERQRLASDLSRANRKARFLASHCPLTGLPNRNLLEDRLTQALASARRSGEQLAMLFLDLDRFKAVNDDFGHHAGDALLREVGTRLHEIVRSSDTVARLGGDEFVVLLGHLADPTSAAIVAEKIIAAVSTPTVFEGHELECGVSIGIAVFPHDGDDRETLMSRADAAMYEAKQQGRNRFHFFTDGMNRASLAHFEFEKDLELSCKRGDFRVHYQPQVLGEDGRIIGAEALVRWDHPTRGIILPAEFIATAETKRLISQIGQGVLRTACRQAVEWKHQANEFEEVSVNISPRQFSQANFVDDVAEALQLSGLAGECLTLDIPESCFEADSDLLRRTFAALRDLGVRASVDGFGTGRSSLTEIRRFAIARLKICPSFVADAGTDRDGAVIARSIIALAASLELETAAVGVETEEQLNFLLDHGCSRIQGFWFGPPVPAAEFGRILERGYLVPKPT